MIQVTILYPNGQRREHVILDVVPNVGDDVRLKDMDDNEPSLVCEHRTLPEGCEVIISVRERPNGR